MAQIRVRVGAALDPGALAIFQPFIAQAAKARAKIAAEGKKGADEYVGGYRSAPAAARAGFDGVAKASSKADEAILKSATKTHDARMRLLRKESDAGIAAAAKEQQLRERSAKAFIGGAARTFGGLVSRGVGLAGSVARGAGVDLDAGSLVGKVTNQQAAATQIANSGYVEGDKGPAGTRADPAKILAGARAAADVARISTDSALEGLQAFVGKTTDLETGQQLLERMAVLSKSTGANMSDVFDAAGSIAVKMGDIPNKAEAVASLMSIIAKQGKLGATEMKAMASNIAGFTGPANKFAEGTGKAVTELGTVFQVLSKSGFAKSAAQASTSVGSFVGDLTGKSGLKALHAGGIKDEDIFADRGKTKLRNLAEIIPKILESSGGDLTKLSKIITNKRSKAVVDAFGQIYNTAEALQKGSGSAAVKAKFGEYAGGTSSQDTAAALAAANDTTASKVQLLNNQLERIAESSAAKVLPALEKLAPSLISAADSAGKIAGWAAENPYAAVAVMAGASIAKEMAGAGLKAIMEGALKQGLAGGLGGALGGTIAVAAATIAIEEAVLSMKAKAQENSADTEVAALNAGSKLGAASKTGVLGADDLAQAEEQHKLLQARIAAASAPTPAMGGTSGVGSGILNFITAGSAGESFSAQTQKSADRDNLEGLKAANERLEKRMGDVHKALSAGVMKVQIMNPQGGMLPGPGPGATTGPAPVR